MKRVAVIGAGTMGKTHAQAYASMPNVQLVGIVDPRAEVATALAARCDTQAFSDLDALLKVTQTDVIDVCVPTYLHKEYVLRAAALGKHVVCEKPIARYAEDAKEMIAACDRAGVQLLIGQVVRFFPEYVHAKKIVNSGEVGDVGVVRTMRGGAFPNGWQDWYASAERSGSLIVDLIIHDIDYLRWCFGDVQRVFAKSLLHRECNRMDHVFASLRFKSGVIAHVEGSWAFPSDFRTELEIAGDKGVIRHQSKASVAIQTSLRQTGEDRSQSVVEVPESPLEHSPYYLELAHFMDCIDGKAEPVITPQDALVALEVSLAVLQSVESGEVVVLP